MSDKYRIAWGDPAFVFRPNGSERRVSAVKELNRLLDRIRELEAEVARLVRVLDTGVGKDALMRFLAGEDRAEATEVEVARLKDAIREHRDSFSKDMDEHDWTTEDEALWELIDEKKPPGGLGG